MAKNKPTNTGYAKLREQDSSYKHDMGRRAGGATLNTGLQAGPERVSLPDEREKETTPQSVSG